MPAPLRDEWETFWSYVREAENGCWVWVRSLSYGYGQFGSSSKGIRRGRTTVAHRIAYEWVIGLIPKGLTLDHLCRNRACVNPAHLEPVTSVENVMRGEGFAPRNAAATVCLHGHAFTEVNTYVDKRGRRHCRPCRARRLREMRARRKAAA